MRASGLYRASLPALGLLFACVFPVRAAETAPEAAASPRPQVAALEESAIAVTPEPEAPGVLLALDPSSAGAGSPESGEQLEDYDPLFDDEFDLDLSGSAVGDPLEGFNRRIFAFNETMDALAWDPMTRGYQFLVPEPLRQGIHRVFLNLESPVVLTNQLFQLRFRDAATTVGRFVVNSTAGAAGFFDAADKGIGWERVKADFGQTLARYGTPSGAYLMVPLFGPSNVRDLCGDVVDRLFDPLTYVIGPIEWWIVLGTGQGLSHREAHSESLDALEAASIDYYSALRSAYHQSREAHVRSARGRGDSADEDPIAIGSY